MSKYRSALLPLLLPMLLLPGLATAQAPDRQEQARPQSATSTTSTFQVRPASSSDASVRGVRTNTSAGVTDRSGSTDALTERNNTERNKGYTEYSAATANNAALVSEICTYSQYTYTYTCK